jgi:hypothetical protein
MKKFIVLFALFACLIPFSASLADICETKCCTSGNCQDQNAFCNTLPPNSYASASACTNETFPANCAATDTKVCCCSKAMGPNDVVSKDILEASAQRDALQAPITSLNFAPEVSIPGSSFTGASIPVGYYSEETTNGVTVGKMNSDLLSKYIQAIYNYGLAIVSILAAIVLMGGGLLWLTSGGDNSRVSKAKEMIIGSITGLVILFCAWIILNTVNPELLKLRPIETIYQTKVNTVCCEHDQTAEMLSEKECETKKGTPFVYLSTALGKTYYRVDSVNNKCDLPGCCVVRTGGGKISSCSNSMKSSCNGNFIGLDCGLAVTSMSEDLGANCPDLCASKDTENGDTCFAAGGSSYCYDGICWNGSGQEGEPCGTKSKGYGTCVKSGTKCDDTNQWGGRHCGTGVKCCLD